MCMSRTTSCLLQYPYHSRHAKIVWYVACSHATYIHCTCIINIPTQAFSICVACLDGKIADRKGYEYLRKLTSGATAEGTEADTVGGEIAHNGVQVRIECCHSHSQCAPGKAGLFFDLCCIVLLIDGQY